MEPRALPSAYHQAAPPGLSVFCKNLHRHHMKWTLCTPLMQKGKLRPREGKHLAWARAQEGSSRAVAGASVPRCACWSEHEVASAQGGRVTLRSLCMVVAVAVCVRGREVGARAWQV
jgi:hypothetical protein